MMAFHSKKEFMNLLLNEQSKEYTIIEIQVRVESSVPQKIGIHKKVW